MKLISTNPSDGYSIIGEVEVSTSDDVLGAVQRARNAFNDWATASLDVRTSAVRSFAECVMKRKDDIADLIALETGRPVSTLSGHIAATYEYLNAYCEMAGEHLAPMITAQRVNERHIVHRLPHGIVAAICPWNYPMLNVAWQCGQALIAGNAIVYKNSEENPLFAELLKELLNGSEIPDGVFNVLQGDGEVGRLMVQSDVDMVSFTGSSATGKAIAENVGRRLIPFVAELGGSSPGIVFDDVDVEAYIEEIFWKRFFHSGQTCDSLKRLIVHRSKFDDVVNRLKDLSESCRIGPGTDPDTQLGPLVAERQVQRITQQVDASRELGAKVVTGGKRPDGLRGAYYAPTILIDVTPEMPVWSEETFGPVLPVVSFRTEDEAISLANDTAYGLTAFIMTDDNERFGRMAQQIDSGAVVQNHGTYDHPSSPFGGWKDSGLGRTHGEYGFHEVTQPKLVSVVDRNDR